MILLKQTACYSLASTSEPEAPTEVDESQQPILMLHPSNLSRNQIAQVKRICQPKPYSGKLDVPDDICKMWNDKKGQQRLLSMWCKSGGLKAGLSCNFFEELSPLSLDLSIVFAPLFSFWLVGCFLGEGGASKCQPKDQEDRCQGRLL